MHLVGIDVSLTATGIARIRPDGSRTPPITLETIASSPSGSGYPAQLERLRNVAGRVVRAARRNAADDEGIVYALEAPIFGTVTNAQGKPIGSAGMAHTRAGLWWLIYHLIEKTGPVITVPPTTLKSYVTGKGNAPKDLVISTVARNFPHLAILDNNQADALGLASMLARQLGSPVEPSPQRVNPAALNGITWPDAFTE